MIEQRLIVRIVAAQVNTIGDEANETVILINTTPQPINLDGWKLLDTQKHQKPLGGVLKPGEPLVVHVRPEVQLSNTGGIISLVNGNNIKIDGVSYTREQASVEGRTIVF